MGLLDVLFGGTKKAAYLKEIYAGGAIVVDVRSPEEFKSGHFENSINIPLQGLAQKTAFLKQKNKPIITVCLSGARSSMAVSLLKKESIDAYNGGSWSSLAGKLKS